METWAWPRPSKIPTPWSQGFSHESEEWDVSKTMFHFQWVTFHLHQYWKKNEKRLHPRKLTWIPKMMVWKRYITPFKHCNVWIIFGIYVRFLGFNPNTKFGLIPGFQIQQARPRLFCGDDAIWVDWWEMSRRNLVDPPQGYPSDKGGWK